jgi:hypothetical protein
MLIYNIVIEEFLLAIKKLHGLVEIWAAIDISYLKNPHPSIYWSGKFMTQSYTWKLKRSTQYSNSTSLYLNIESDPFISDWVLVKIPSAQTHRAAQHVPRAQTHRAAQHVPKTQTHRAAQHVPKGSNPLSCSAYPQVANRWVSGYYTESLTMNHSGYHVWRVPRSLYLFSGSQKLLSQLTHPFPHFWIVFINNWTCPCTEYNCNAARWMLSK